MITLKQTPTILFIIWTLSLLIAILTVASLRMCQWIEYDSLTSLFGQINGTYSPYVGIMLTFYAAKKRAESFNSSPQIASFAVGASLLFNLLVLSRLAMLVISEQDNVAKALPDLTNITSALHWCVAPVLGVYFADSSAAK